MKRLFLIVMAIVVLVIGVVSCNADSRTFKEGYDLGYDIGYSTGYSQGKYDALVGKGSIPPPPPPPPPAPR